MKKKMIKKKYIPAIIILSLFIIIVIISLINQDEVEQEIRRNQQETIAEIYRTHSNRSFNHIYYKYYFNNNVYESFEDIDLFSRKYVRNSKGRFFKVYLSSKNPKYSRIQLDKEVTDTIKIKAAGFSLDPDKKD